MPGRELLEANRDRCPQLNHIPVPVSEANLMWGTNGTRRRARGMLSLSRRRVSTGENRAAEPYG